jgi:hypothetical protein
VIVASAGLITSAISAATDMIPIIASGPYTGSGVLPSLARPGGNMTGVRLEEPEIYGKRLQILKEAVPSASKVGYLNIRTISASGQQAREELRKASQILDISLSDILVEESRCRGQTGSGQSSHTTGGDGRQWRHLLGPLPNIGARSPNWLAPTGCDHREQHE